jgi:hypothetical protein
MEMYSNRGHLELSDGHIIMNKDRLCMIQVSYSYISCNIGGHYMYFSKPQKETESKLLGTPPLFITAFHKLKYIEI